MTGKLPTFIHCVLSCRKEEIHCNKLPSIPHEAIWIISVLSAIRCMEGYFGCCFLLCPVTGISVAAASIGGKFLHDGTYQSRTGLLPFWEPCPQAIPKSEIVGLNFGHLTADISKMVSRSVTHQLVLNITSTSVIHGAVAPLAPLGECTPSMVGFVLLTHLLA